MDAILDSIIEGANRIKVLGEIADQKLRNHLHHIDDMVWTVLNCIEEQQAEQATETAQGETDGS